MIPLQTSILASFFCLLALSCSTPAGHSMNPQETVAAQSKIEADLEAIGKAIKHYQMNNGGHAPESLEVLVALDSKGHRYFEDAALPLDPYGQAYAYRLDESLPLGWSLQCLDPAGAN